MGPFPVGLFPVTLFPGRGELAFLTFVVRGWPLGRRLAVAAGLFATGLALWLLAPLPAALVGLPVILAGHLPLWVRGLTTAPGGATPKHNEIWAPVEEDWLERVTKLEERGEKWDASPWDLTSGRGGALLVGLLLIVAVATGALAALLDAAAAARLGLGLVLLVVPQWLNGMRTTWNPSELKLKGEALEVARRAALELAPEEFEPVPMLALAQSTKGGDYPVDARLMLRPAEDDGSGYLGVQVQVAINNVRGKDYPYLYCVVLSKGELDVAAAKRGPRRSRKRMVFEPGGDGEVSFLVVRRHADNHGGWHTDPETVRILVAEALSAARRATGRAGRGSKA